MSKPVALDAAGLAFARAEFARYYATVRLDPPARFTRREFAVFPFGPTSLMRRHSAFAQADEIREFLAREAPRHVYYSSAYYRRPDHASMPQKEWLGADLIFDLDADHLRHAEGLDYPAQLALVHRRFRDLLDDFLFKDFAIDPSETTIAFSGGRGYHLHVHAPAYLTLTSAERREIVEYVMGLGIDPRSAVRTDRPREPATDRGAPGARPRRHFTSLVDPSAPGWPGRLSRSVLGLIDRWEAEGAAAAEQDLLAAGMERAVARKIARQIVTEGKGRWMRDGLALDVFKGAESERFLDAVLALARIEVQGETDAPVTTDIHRLIRLPGSLHGGTGLRVVRIGYEALSEFDPLRMAVLPDPGGPGTWVEALQTVRYPFGAGELSVTAGERARLAAPAALFLLLRGEATVVSPGASS